MSIRNCLRDRFVGPPTHCSNLTGKPEESERSPGVALRTICTRASLVAAHNNSRYINRFCYRVTRQTLSADMFPVLHGYPLGQGYSSRRKPAASFQPFLDRGKYFALSRLQKYYRIVDFNTFFSVL